jgi:hypothetical protein
MTESEQLSDHLIDLREAIDELGRALTETDTSEIVQPITRGLESIEKALAMLNPHTNTQGAVTLKA